MASSSPAATSEAEQPQADQSTAAAAGDSNGATNGGNKPAKAAPTLADTFKLHASKSNGSEATGADISKWCKDAGITGKTCDPGHVDISFTKAKTKGAKNITFNEMEALINELAIKYKVDHKLDNEEIAKHQITDKLIKTKPKTHGTTKTSKTGGVSRMTDVKTYTGSHKERFDADTGKGKGKEGRADTTKNTGYVGNYKNEGTYNKKTTSTSTAKQK